MNVADRQRPRPGELFLDHVSHFVPDVDAAARVLEQLGFCVTPLSIQIADGKPAGTANRCVMLETGYLEFLAPAGGIDTPNARRLRERIDRFVGVHLACFGTPDAEAERRRLDAHGFGVLPLVELEREVEGGATVRFKVVRVEPEAMPEGRIQYVQQLTPEHIWTERNLAHENGVIGLDALYVVADDRGETAARWARFAALLPQPDGHDVILRTARGAVVVGEHVELTKTVGAMPAPPALAGYALKCRDAVRFAARCRDAGLRVERNVVTLPPSMGGCWLLT